MNENLSSNNVCIYTDINKKEKKILSLERKIYILLSYKDRRKRTTDIDISLSLSFHEPNIIQPMSLTHIRRVFDIL